MPVEAIGIILNGATGRLGTSGWTTAGHQELVDVRLHGGGQTEPSHVRVQFLDAALCLWAVKPLDSEGNLHFAVGRFDAPALLKPCDDGLGRKGFPIQKSRYQDYGLPCLTKLGPSSGNARRMKRRV